MIKTGDYVRGDSGLEGFVERIVDDNLQSKKKLKKKLKNNFSFKIYKKCIT